MRFIVILVALYLLAVIASNTAKADNHAWILVEWFDVVVYPTGERVKRGIPIAGPYQHLKNTRKMSCGRARIILSVHLTSEELQRVRCVPVRRKQR
jgi:hypothetical protein